MRVRACVISGPQFYQLAASLRPAHLSLTWIGMPVSREQLVTILDSKPKSIIVYGEQDGECLALLVASGIPLCIVSKRGCNLVSVDCDATYISGVDGESALTKDLQAYLASLVESKHSGS